MLLTRVQPRAQYLPEWPKPLPIWFFSGVALNRIAVRGTSGGWGVSNNKAVIKYIEEHCAERGVELVIPPDHEFISAIGVSSVQDRFPYHPC